MLVASNAIISILSPGAPMLLAGGVLATARFAILLDVPPYIFPDT